MVKRMLILTSMVICMTYSASGQNAFATLKLNRTKVYPNQPIKATFTVYTATWFTEPLKFENLVIPNAFVIPFKRTQSGMHTINRKQYAGLEFFFLVYPYDVGTYEIPPFNITAVTPKEGDYKGVSVTLQTKPTSFEVRPVPDSFEGEKWLVATNIRLSDRWDKPLTNIKVGDVVNRSIRINASGTLPSLIPELTYAPLSFARIYPKSPETEDNRSSSQANGIRIENRTYLFEKEGSFVIPEEVVYFWHPYKNRQEQRTLKEIAITVNPNNDLGMVASVRDSLENTISPEVTDEAEDTPFAWDVWLIRLAWFAIALINIWLLIKVGKAAYTRWEHYKMSSGYLKKAAVRASKKSSSEFFSKFYRWWDSFNSEPSIRETMKSQHLKQVEAHYLQNESPGKDATELIHESEKNITSSIASNLPSNQRPFGSES